MQLLIMKLVGSGLLFIWTTNHKCLSTAFYTSSGMQPRRFSGYVRHKKRGRKPGEKGVVRGARGVGI